MTHPAEYAAGWLNREDRDEMARVTRAIEERWAWQNQAPELVQWCTARWAEFLPGSSPAELWDRMSVPTRQELVWNWEHRSTARSAFEEDAARIRAECDAETLAFWNRLVQSESAPQEADNDDWGGPIPTTDIGGSAW